MNMRLMLALCVLAVPSLVRAGEGAAPESATAGSGMVTLSWDGAGDFGPQTPGTKTAGWQEALDHCVKNARDLYVRGGWGGRKPVYNVSETIRIPASQDFRIDGGVYVLNWTGAPDDPSKDLLVMDSAMNCEYHLGILVYGGAGAALRVRPENPVPIDNFRVVTETLVVSQGMADPAPFTRGERKTGSGLVFDGSKGSIVSNRFDFIGGILNFATCVEIAGDYRQNRFSCLHLHTNADRSTLLRAGEGACQNIFDLVIGVDMGAENVTGLVFAGRNNRIEVNTRGGFPAGNDVVLLETARGNRVDLLHGQDKFIPEAFVTDKAPKGSNRVTGTGGQ